MSEEIELFGFTFKIYDNGIVWMTKPDGEGMVLNSKGQEEIKKLLYDWWEKVF